MPDDPDKQVEAIRAEVEARSRQNAVVSSRIRRAQRLSRQAKHESREADRAQNAPQWDENSPPPSEETH